MSTFQPRLRSMLIKDIKSNVGPCMITFSIPLLIPGITLTLVGFAGEAGFGTYGSLHVLGLLILVLSILIFILGCVFKCSFRTMKVAPLEETHRVVTTHSDKLNHNYNNSNSDKTIKVKRESEENTLADIYKNNNLYHHQLHHPTTSTSSEVRKTSSEFESGIKASESVQTKNSDISQTSSSNSHKELIRQDSVDSTNYDRQKFQRHADPDPYPLGRLPSLDLKHTKFSQDKADEEMSIIDETKGNYSTDDLGDSSRKHLGDLPDLSIDFRRVILSDDTTSYTSTSSMSGQIIDTNAGHANTDQYQRY